MGFISVGKVLAWHACDSGFNPRHHINRMLVVQACNLSTPEIVAGPSKVQGQLGQYETWSQQKTNRSVFLLVSCKLLVLTALPGPLSDLLLLLLAASWETSWCGSALENLVEPLKRNRGSVLKINVFHALELYSFSLGWSFSAYTLVLA